MPGSGTVAGAKADGGEAKTTVAPAPMVRPASVWLRWRRVVPAVASRVTPPEPIAPLISNVPAPLFATVPTPEMLARVMSWAPPRLSVWPPRATAPKERSPAVAPKLAFAPSPTEAAIVCEATLLFTMPPAPTVIASGPVMVNPPAVFWKVRLATLHAVSTLGVSRTPLAKVSVAVPLFSGSTLRFQLSPVLQSLFAPPPSHTRPVTAGSSATLSVPSV